jgi:hypothetical protein
MAGYVPHHRKKRDRLERLECDLLRSIQIGDSRERIIEIAEQVRQARIRVYRAELSRIAPDGKKAEAEDSIAARIEEWQHRSVESIIETFEKKRSLRYSL